MSDARRRPHHGRCDEHGFALVFAIVMMVLIMGFLAVFTLATSTGRNERQTERGRMQSEVWADAASNAIAARLESGEFGYETVPAIVDGKRGRLLKRPLVGAFAGTGVSHGTGSCAPSWPITTSTGEKGYYCIRPVETGKVAGDGFINLEPADPKHGTVKFVVRAWGTKGAIRPIDAELTFGREALSRYAVLSDAPIWLDKSLGSGSLTLPAGARLHSNNTSNSNYGVYIRGQVNHSGAKRITTTRSRSGIAVSTSGGAAGCPNGNKCYISGKTVSFNSTYTMFNRVDKADPNGTCPVNNMARYSTTSNKFRMCKVPYTRLFPAVAAGSMPMFYVDVSQNCVRYRRTRYPLREDSLSYPVVDDSKVPTTYGSYTTLCPNSGGGALLFEGDVVLVGRRPTGSPGVTIMARRPRNNNQQRVRMRTASGWVFAQVAEAASIYIMPTTIGGTGSGQTLSALGVVAEGGVYIPTRYATGNLTVVKASLIAAGSGFSLGPSFQQIAGDTGVVDQTGTDISAGGIDPCSTAAGLPTGGTFRFNGTIASRQVPFISYVRGCNRGYTNRQYYFDTELGWNPPPFFPSPSSWHLVDSRVFST